MRGRGDIRTRIPSDYSDRVKFAQLQRSLIVKNR